MEALVFQNEKGHPRAKTVKTAFENRFTLTPISLRLFEASTSAPLSSAIDAHKSKTQLVKAKLSACSAAVLLSDALKEAKPR